MLDTGIYVNLFKVEFDSRATNFALAARSNFPKLKDLRGRLNDGRFNARIYAVSDVVYGYGQEQDRLVELGFRIDSLVASEVPQLASRLIIEGYTDSLVQAGYALRWSFGRATVFQVGHPLLKTDRGVMLLRGFELQSLYLLDPETDQLTFGVVADAVFSYRDPENRPMHPNDVATRFGRETLGLLRTRQGDLAPRGGINLEVSRQRLVEMILPFVAARNSFMMPNGLPAKIESEPMRVVLAAEES